MRDKGTHGFGGAALADRAVGSHVGHTQEAEVAQAGAVLDRAFVGERAFQVRDLEWEAGGGCPEVGAHGEGAVGDVSDEGLADRGLEVGVGAQREQGARLNADGAGGLRGHEPLGRAVGAREPERQADCSDLLQVRVVAGPELWLSRLVEHHLSARGRVVAARLRALDHEAVRTDFLVAREVFGQDVGRHDRQE